MNIKKMTSLVIAALCVCASFTQAGTLTDPNFGFTITIPDGFVADPQLLNANENFLYAFRKPGKRESISDSVILIERLHGTIGRTRLRPEDMPKNFEGTLTTDRWNGFDVDGVELIENVAGIQVLTCKAHVPLQNEAICVWAGGNLDHGPQTRELLNQLLDSLHANTNWSSTASSAEQLGQSVGFAAVFTVAAVAALVAGVVRFAKRMI